MVEVPEMIPYKDLHPSSRFPWITITLIAVNLGVFLYQVFLPESQEIRFIEHYAVVPAHFHGPTVLTALFLHGGLFHLIGNMLYLWIFGDNVEDRMGPIRFLFFYLLCGIVATVAQLYANLQSTLPALGASGAIAGILAAYLRLFPKAKIAVLIPIFYFFRTIILPAWLVLGFWILLQFLEVRLAPSDVAQPTGGIAYFAHIGGFAAGFLLMPLFVRKKIRR